MATHNERSLLKAFYPTSPSWAAKVDKMSDAQVIAVLRRLQSQKKS
jgi:hypothetical protein